MNQNKDYSDLKALYINTTLKPNPQTSNTAGLMQKSEEIMKKQGIHVEHLRLTDYQLPPGLKKDMTEHGFEKDDWPELYKKIQDADILVIGTPIWLGEKSSVCQRFIERLYGQSGELNSKGQYAYYGKTGGCIITGNEDGIKHCAMTILYALQHMGYTIPPQADCGWIGEAGPGPSYLDEDSNAENNDFTNRNTTFMTWNLIHTARILKDLGGFPAYGNQKDKWEDGTSFDFPNPEYH